MDKEFKKAINFYALLVLLLLTASKKAKESCFSSLAGKRVASIARFNDSLVAVSGNQTLEIYSELSSPPLFSFEIQQEPWNIFTSANYVVLQTSADYDLFIYEIDWGAKKGFFHDKYKGHTKNVTSVLSLFFENKFISSDNESIHLWDPVDLKLIRNFAYANIRKLLLSTIYLVGINNKVNFIEIKDDEDLDDDETLTNFHLELEKPIGTALSDNFLFVFQDTNIYSLDLKASLLTNRTLKNGLRITEPLLLSHLGFLFYVNGVGELKYYLHNDFASYHSTPDKTFMRIAPEDRLIMMDYRTGFLMLVNQTLTYYNLSKWPVDITAQSGCESVCEVESCLQCNDSNLTECLVFQHTATICPNNCKECDDFGQCLSCAPNFVLYSNKCNRISTCQAGHYFDISRISGPICRNCVSGCLTCNNSYACITCEAGFVSTPEGLCSLNSSKKNISSLNRINLTMQGAGPGLMDDKKAKYGIIIASSVGSFLVMLLCLLKGIYYLKKKKRNKLAIDKEKSSPNANNVKSKVEHTEALAPVPKPALNADSERDPLAEHEVKINVIVVAATESRVSPQESCAKIPQESSAKIPPAKDQPANNNNIPMKIRIEDPEELIAEEMFPATNKTSV